MIFSSRSDKLPRLAQSTSHPLIDSLARHPRRIMAGIGALLLGTGVTAFGIAPLAPDALVTLAPWRGGGGRQRIAPVARLTGFAPGTAAVVDTAAGLVFFVFDGFEIDLLLDQLLDVGHQAGIAARHQRDRQARARDLQRPNAAAIDGVFSPRSTLDR